MKKLILILAPIALCCLYGCNKDQPKQDNNQQQQQQQQGCGCPCN